MGVKEYGKSPVDMPDADALDIARVVRNGTPRYPIAYPIWRKCTQTSCVMRYAKESNSKSSTTAKVSGRRTTS